MKNTTAKSSMGTRTLIVVLSLVAWSGCSSVPGGSIEGDTTPLKVVVLDDGDVDEIRARYEPLLDYLSASLELGVELEVESDYATVVEGFGIGAYDLAYLDSVTFVDIHDRFGTVPLFVTDVDSFSQSYLLSMSANAGRKLEDFSGSSLAFGPPRSTSGHIMPRVMIEAEGVQTETFFREVSFAESDQQIIDWIREGRVDLGAVSVRSIVQTSNGDLVDEGELVVVAVTPPYSEALWAVRLGMPDDLEFRIGESFYGLTRTNPDHRAILDPITSNGFLPVNIDDDFAELALAYVRYRDEAP